MSVSVGPAFAGYDASQMAIVTSCETTITSIVHDVNDNHAKLGKDIASGVAASTTTPCRDDVLPRRATHERRHLKRSTHGGTSWSRMGSRRSPSKPNLKGVTY